MRTIKAIYNPGKRELFYNDKMATDGIHLEKSIATMTETLKSDEDLVVIKGYSDFKFNNSTFINKRGSILSNFWIGKKKKFSTLVITRDSDEDLRLEVK